MSEKPSTNELIGSVAQLLLDDMSRSADMRVELAESIGYDRGYDAGFIAGQNSVRQTVRNFIYGFKEIAGLNPKIVEE